MNKILLTSASAPLGTSSYESPAMSIVEVHSEGVLCMSSPDHEGWTIDEHELDW